MMNKKKKEKCVFSECTNNSDFHLGFGNSKGTIPICRECYNLYNDHHRARVEVQIDAIREKVLKIMRR